MEQWRVYLEKGSAAQEGEEEARGMEEREQGILPMGRAWHLALLSDKNHRGAVNGQRT